MKEADLDRLPGAPCHPLYWHRQFGSDETSWIAVESAGTDAASSLRQCRRETALAWRVLTAHQGAKAPPVPAEAQTVRRILTESNGSAGAESATLWGAMLRSSGNAVLQNDNPHPWAQITAKIALAAIVRRATAHLLRSGFGSVTVSTVDATLSQGAYAYVSCGLWGNGSTGIPTSPPMRAAILASALAEGMTSHREGSVRMRNEMAQIPTSATLRARLAAELDRTAQSDTLAATAVLRAIGADREARAFHDLYGGTP